jgi:hypothetical protein
LPILGYLKIDNGTITKTGLECFLVQEIDCKGSVLLLENIFFDFLGRTKEQYITITVKDKRVTLSDGSIPNISFPEEDIKNFPATSVPETKPIELSNEIFSAIGYAANYADHMDLPDARAHVFLGKKAVFGGNGLICYMEKFKEDLPEVALLKETALVVGKFNYASFSENEKYVFFENGNCKYGFIKSMYPFADMTSLITFDKKSKSFVLDKAELLTFSDMCVSSTKSLLKVPNMAVKQNKLNLEMVDIDFEVNVNKSIPIGDGEMDDDFAFNPVQMSTLLKNTPDDELTFYRKNGSLIITGDSGFTSIIQQLQKI